MQDATISFTVAAIAQHPFTYQWQKDGVAIADATNATLVITSVEPSQAGLYTVALSNFVSGVVSAPAALVVMPSSGVGAPGLTADGFGFGLRGPAGLSIVVETSTNLHQWLPLSTNSFDSGWFQFMDPDPATKPMRFYRTRF